MDWADPTAVAEYGAADSDLALRLFYQLRTRLEEEGLWELYELERACLPVLGEMALRGVVFDPAPLVELGSRLTAELEEVESVIRGYFNVPMDTNLNSDHMLRELLYGPMRVRAVVDHELAGRRQHVPDCSRKGCVDMECAGGVRTGQQVVLKWLPAGLAWPVKVRTPAGEPAVDMNTLRLYDDPLVGDLVRIKSIRQALENNVTRLPQLVHEDGRIHPTFHQGGVWEDGGAATEAPRTGRLSSSGPNLQNVTNHGTPDRPYVAEWAKYIRRGFVAAPGMVLVRADIGQEEPRLAAFLAQDHALLEELETGDVYCPVASMEFGRIITKQDSDERQIGKRGFMAWLNGAGASGIQESAFWLTNPEAARVVKWLQEKYPVMERYRVGLVRLLHERGYTTTYFGRRIHRPEVWSGPGPARAHAERSVMPDAIQGTAADVMKIWLPRLAHELAPNAHLLLTIHDEVVVEVASDWVERAVAACTAALDGIIPVHLPCEVSVGPNWADMVRVS